jgi:RHS repeat-associated protein
LIDCCINPRRKRPFFRQIRVKTVNFTPDLSNTEETTYNYDEAGQVGLATSVPGYTAPPGSVYGHVTTTNESLNTGGSNPITKTYWLKSGKIDHKIDALGNSTSYTYDATGEFLLQITYPPANSIPHQEEFTFDPNIGRPTSHTDENQKQTRYTFNPYGSLIGVTYPDVGALSISYNGYANPLTVNETVTNGYGTTLPLSNAVTAVSDPSQETTVIHDGLGRVTQRIALAGTANPLTTTTAYDSMDRVATVSDPYYGSGPVYNTSYSYDVLNRKIAQLNPDSTGVSWSYSGTSVTYTDEKKNQWQRTYDALGRLTTVLEPNGAAQSPSMETDYTYDALGNLWSVNQWGGASGSSGAIARAFTYDSLSRLISATNPETGTVSYSYDANGNLLSKTSPLVNATSGTQTIGYCYDVLNRLVAKSNAAPPANCTSASSIPAANLLDTYTFDTSSLSGATNDVGRLTDEKAYSGGTLVAERGPYAYDAMGRLQKEQQFCLLTGCNGAVYTPAYTYDYAGNVATATVGLPSSTTGQPSSMEFVYGYDAGNRLIGVSSTVPESANYPSVLFEALSTTPLAYAPAGLANASLGVNVSGNSTLINLARNYDSRERILEETDTAPSGELLTAATGSTGNITVSGTETGPLAAPATSGSATLSVIGTDGSHLVQTCVPIGGLQHCTYHSVPDSGTISVIIDGFTSTANYLGTSTDASLASSLTSRFNVSGSPVTAVQNGASFTVTAVATGSASNYPITISNGDFSISDPNNALSGGQNAAAVYDAGTVTVTITSTTGSYATTAVPWGQGSTPASLASSLASAINTAAGSIVTATSSGGSVYMASTGTGPTVNCSVSASVSDTQKSSYPSLFPNSSFTVKATPMSGGAEATTDPNGAAYSYSIPQNGGYDGVGNVVSVADSVTGAWTYGYDTLNRLTSANGASGPYQGYNGCWAYDPFGNRTAESYQTAACPTPETSVPATASYNASNQVTWTSVNAAVNGFSYDAAGNVLNDGANLYLYDIEGRLCAVGNQFVGSVTEYVYDAEGRRVAKGTLSSWPSSCVAPTVANSFTLTTSYEIGLGGEQMSELAVSGSTNPWQHTNVFAGGKLLATYSGTSTYIPLTDWLGTKRAEVAPGGKFSTYFSLPWGNGLAAGGDANDATEHHFTGKERDSESGNDYFGARYYASSMGRFMSPDPLPWIHWQNGNRDAQAKFGGFISNPQNFNMYAYVNNNPLNKTDPTGMNACGTNNDATCHVTVTFADRTRDSNGNYNDKFTGLAHQEDYNATATVTVTGTGADGKAFSASGTFLARALSDDGSAHATIANGTYDATSFTKSSHSGNYEAILLTGGIPTAVANPSRSDGQSIAFSIEVHKAGLDGVAVASDPSHPISAGCQTIYRDQFSDFQRVTGLVPTAGSEQGSFSVTVSTGENTVYNPN